MAGDDGADVIFSEEIEIIIADALGDIEILIVGFVGIEQEEGVVHEDDEILLVLPMGVFEGLDKPIPLFLIFAGGVFVVEDDIAVEGDKAPGAEVETIPVLMDLLAIPDKVFEGGGVADVVIAGNQIECNMPVELSGDAKDGVELFLVSGFIDDVAGEHDELGAEAIGMGDGLSEEQDFLLEIDVGGEHAELGIGHLEEKKGLIMHFVLFHS